MKLEPLATDPKQIDIFTGQWPSSLTQHTHQKEDYVWWQTPVLNCLRRLFVPRAMQLYNATQRFDSSLHGDPMSYAWTLPGLLFFLIMGPTPRRAWTITGLLLAIPTPPPNSITSFLF